MNRTLKGAGIYLVILVLIVFIVQYSGGQSEKIEDMQFSNVYKELQDGNISSLHIVDQTGIEGTLKDSNSGPKRKYYKLTKEGEEALENFKKDWSELDLAVNTLLQGKEDNYEENFV